MTADVLDLRSILLQLRLCLISAKQGLIQRRSQSRAVSRDSSESVGASKASFGPMTSRLIEDLDVGLGCRTGGIILVNSLPSAVQLKFVVAWRCTVRRLFWHL